MSLDSSLSPPAHLASALSVEDWGRTRYDDALAAQRQAVDDRLASQTGDRLIFTEHDPVFTVGLRKDSRRHLIWEPAHLASVGIEVAATNRGGDITYHGPGQIVGYPIVSLAHRPDLHAYLRLLEDVLIATVGDFGLTAVRRPGLTGIWIGSRKLAAIGVAVRRWVTYHGFALNVAPDLRHFEGIVPCGIAPTEGTVTSLAAELGPSAPTLAQTRARLAHHFQSRWQLHRSSPDPQRLPGENPPAPMSSTD